MSKHILPPKENNSLLGAEENFAYGYLLAINKKAVPVEYLRVEPPCLQHMATLDVLARLPYSKRLRVPGTRALSRAGLGWKD
ncbi:hypothetical protein E4U16_003327 [Claviceps sp. LM84 group G4]|nr:hypothetical protein E4U33_003194 [Claviceps sp. LM78 group G4]KAG6075518.1 hypothetical protein E4U16_003327 [Claviceps sp. LM84 group G4]